MKRMIAVTLVALLPILSLAHAETREQIHERIRPVGMVNIKGGSANDVKVAAVKPAKKVVDGESIYKSHCVVCHASGVAGAPIIGSKDGWGPRQKKGIKGLLASAIKGINAMPARGTCSECSDEQLKMAIHYMLPK